MMSWRQGDFFLSEEQEWKWKQIAFHWMQKKKKNPNQTKQNTHQCPEVEIFSNTYKTIKRCPDNNNL